MVAKLLLCSVLCVRLASSVKTAASPAGWLSYCSTSAAEQEEEIGKYQPLCFSLLTHDMKT